MSGDGQDIRYTQLHSLDRSASTTHSSTEPRNSKSDSNFFRPFDTKSLTNGYHSGTTDVEKFSSSFKSHSDQRNKSDSHKHKHREDVHHSHHKHNDSSSSNDHKLRQDKARLGRHEDSKKGNHSVHSHSISSSLNHQHSHKLSKSTNHSSHSHRESQKALRSRLDLEEQRLKKKRALDPYYTDSDEEEDAEELEKGKLLLITSGPSLPVDENPEKMSFLETIGLTSLRVKKGKPGGYNLQHSICEIYDTVFMTTKFSFKGTWEGNCQEFYYLQKDWFCITKIIDLKMIHLF